MITERTVNITYVKISGLEYEKISLRKSYHKIPEIFTGN